jgi:hypothetical protein
LWPQPTCPACLADFDSIDSRSQLHGGACRSRLIGYEPRSTVPQPIRPGNHTTTSRLLGKHGEWLRANLEVIDTGTLHKKSTNLKLAFLLKILWKI